MRKLLALAAVALLAACNPMEQAEGADELAATFHEHFSAGEFDAIWNEASDEFRANTPRTQFDNAFGNLHRFYGEYQGGSREGISLNSNNGVTTTEISMATTYANSRANETFTFVGTGEDMALLNWTINADDGSGDADDEGEADEAEAAANDKSVD